jgi:hypothetical protein
METCDDQTEIYYFSRCHSLVIHSVGLGTPMGENRDDRKGDEADELIALLCRVGVVHFHAKTC